MGSRYLGHRLELYTTIVCRTVHILGNHCPQFLGNSPERASWLNLFAGIKLSLVESLYVCGHLMSWFLCKLAFLFNQPHTYVCANLLLLPQPLPPLVHLSHRSTCSGLCWMSFFTQYLMCCNCTGVTDCVFCAIPKVEECTFLPAQVFYSLGKWTINHTVLFLIPWPLCNTQAQLPYPTVSDDQA